MKLLPILLLISLTATAQKKDSLLTDTRNVDLSSTWSIFSDTGHYLQVYGDAITGTIRYYPDTFITTYDTTKVMLLCADTTFVPGYTASRLFTDSTGSKGIVIENRFSEVFWMFGYEVTGKDPDGYILTTPITWQYRHYPHISYLDIYKQPLPNYIVVFKTL